MEETEELDHLADGAPEPRPDVRLLRSITLRNILSFGPDTPPLELRALNVLIGPNGSGKSNLLACLSLLPGLTIADWGKAFRTGGSSTSEWFWQGQSFATLEVVIASPGAAGSVRHELLFQEANYQPRIQREAIRSLPDNAAVAPEGAATYLGDYTAVLPVLQFDGQSRPGFGVDLYRSILMQVRDNVKYPSFSQLIDAYESIRFFRDWTFGSDSPIREPQRADLPGNFLREGGANLAMVLNQLRRDSGVKQRIVETLNELYEGIEDYETIIHSGFVGLYLREGKQLIPASRLSDGTLRFLCLLAILLHPTPPPLICLEEPELGLHPDVIVAVGKLIKEASERTQLIVTTHSQVLIDTLSATPEDVIVCGKINGATVMERLQAEPLAKWMETYGSLGNLWSRGFLGNEAGNGNRW